MDLLHETIWSTLALNTKIVVNCISKIYWPYRFNKKDTHQWLAYYMYLLLLIIHISLHIILHPLMRGHYFLPRTKILVTLSTIIILLAPRLFHTTRRWFKYNLADVLEYNGTVYPGSYQTISTHYKCILPNIYINRTI